MANTDSSQDKDRKALSAAGLRVTGQRALLLEIIRHGEGHMDADELYRRARERLPRLSLSTVYRALQKFKGLGLVDEFHFNEAHHHYEARQPAGHHHLVCLKCGRVIEFQYPLARQVRRSVPEARDFDIVSAEVRMSGYCSQCRQGKQ